MKVIFFILIGLLLSCSEEEKNPEQILPKKSENKIFKVVNRAYFQEILCVKGEEHPHIHFLPNTYDLIEEDGILSLKYKSTGKIHLKIKKIEPVVVQSDDFDLNDLDDFDFTDDDEEPLDLGDLNLIESVGIDGQNAISKSRGFEFSYTKEGLSSYLIKEHLSDFAKLRHKITDDVIKISSNQKYMPIFKYLDTPFVGAFSSIDDAKKELKGTIRLKDDKLQMLLPLTNDTYSTSFTTLPSVDFSNASANDIQHFVEVTSVGTNYKKLSITISSNSLNGAFLSSAPIFSVNSENCRIYMRGMPYIKKRVGNSIVHSIHIKNDIFKECAEEGGLPFWIKLSDENFNFVEYETI